MDSIGHEVIEQLVLWLVFPGLVFSILVGLVFVWVSRKVTALVQWRVGPPLSQPLWDVVKLLGKETVVPVQGWTPGFLAAPLVALSAAGLAAAVVWAAALGMETALVGDLVVVLYLLSIPALAAVLGGAASGNPLSAIGVSREVKLMLAYELPFVIAVLVAVFQNRYVDGEMVSAGTLSLVGLLDFQASSGSFVTQASGVLAFIVAILCAQAKLGLVPFDVAEAECEIGEGSILEYSGAGLGLLKLTHAILLAALPVFLVTVFWGGMEPTPVGGVVFALKVVLILVVFTLVRNTNPRVRIDQALRFFWGPATVLALVALALARLGI